MLWFRNFALYLLYVPKDQIDHYLLELTVRECALIPIALRLQSNESVNPDELHWSGAYSSVGRATDF
jgi:hypothetical protein